MSELTPTISFYTTIYLFIPFIFAYLAKKLNISPIVGYIIGGLFLGNFFGSFVNSKIISNFAYLGILLLMFTVGLELNFTRLLQLKKYIILGGLVQIIFSILFITLVSLLFNFSLLVSFLIGIALSSSSTGLVAKIVQDRGEDQSFVGEVILGVLMFQDIAFIPFLIIFNSLTLDNESLINIISSISVGILKSSLIIFAMYYLGNKVVPYIFDKVARRSMELLNILIIIFIFSITYFFSLVGVSVIIGVFVAGIIVSQSSKYHHIFTQIRPFRDILVVVFFILIGSQIRLIDIFTKLPSVMIFTVLVVSIKIILLISIFLLLRLHTRIVFTIGLYLFQASESAFILTSYAYSKSVLDRGDYLFITTSVLITLLLTPLVLSKKDNFYVVLRNFIHDRVPSLDIFINRRIDSDLSPIDALSLKNHVVLCGYGRVGNYIGRALTMSNIPFIAIDYYFPIVEKYKEKGVNIIYGDSTDLNILDFAEVDNAQVLISVIPGRRSQEAIVLNAKKLNPRIKIITRIHNEKDQKRIKDMGAGIIIQPEFEASLSITRKILLSYGVDKEKIVGNIKRLKIEHGMI